MKYAGIEVVSFMFKKHHLPLLVGFGLPLLMILFVILSIYLPSLFIKPTYDFIYSSGNDYYTREVYSVKNGQILETPPVPNAYDNRPYISPQLYLHDVETNTSRQILLTDAQRLILDYSAKSPDGFTLQNGNRATGFFPFFWSDRDYKSHYLVKENFSKQVDVESGTLNYYNTIDFIGWVIE